MTVPIEYFSIFFFHRPLDVRITRARRTLQTAFDWFKNAIYIISTELPIVEAAD